VTDPTTGDLATIKRNGYPCSSGEFWGLVATVEALSARLNAALDVIAWLLDGWEPVAGEWVKFTGYSADSPPNPNFDRQTITGAERVVLDCTEDRQP
jgi:hypothetical protein